MRHKLARLTALSGIALITLTSCAAVHPQSAPSIKHSTVATVSPPAPCAAPGPYSFAFQAPDGTVRGCLRVGPLTPGDYEVVAQPSVRPTAVASTLGGALSLNPDHGPPGTVVTVSGFALHTSAAQRQDGEVDMCWAGCNGFSSAQTPASAFESKSTYAGKPCPDCNGLVDSVVLYWSGTSPGQFDFHFTVPQVPWMGTDGIHNLYPGPYHVLLPCLPADEADLKPPTCLSNQWQGTFTLTAPAREACSAQVPCAQLHVTPASAPPGTVITVYGWEPLLSLTGGETSWWNLGFEPVYPAGTTATQTPRTGQAILHVTAPPAWSALGTVKPAWVQTSAFQQLTADPLNPNRIAYCTDNAINVSADGGRSWTGVPLAGVPAASRAIGFQDPYRYGGPFTCDGLWLDPSHPLSIYSVFTTLPRNGTAPPFDFVAFVTTDMGRTWKAVPSPPGIDQGAFGGFSVDVAGAQALFSTGDGFAVEQTSDGGRSWLTGTLRCPTTGPCAQLGPERYGRCAAVGAWRGIELSADRGRTWAVPAWPSQVDGCFPQQLAGSGASTVIDTGDNQYGMIVSRDGGATWEAIALPPLPGMPGSNLGLASLMLPDGGLLSDSTPPYLLAPGASAWCRLPTLAETTNQVSNAPLESVIAGNRLLIAAPASGAVYNTPTQVIAVPLSSIHC